MTWGYVRGVWPPCCATSSSSPAIHSASHVDHEKELHGFYFYACMWFCSYSYDAPLGSRSGRQGSSCTIREHKNKHKLTDSEQRGSAKD